VLRPYVRSGRRTVYNLTVDGAHEFYASGVLVSNCDALRYLLGLLIKGGHPRAGDDAAPGLSPSQVVAAREAEDAEWDTLLARHRDRPGLRPANPWGPGGGLTSS
jgi:hypothetical protein